MLLGTSRAMEASRPRFSPTSPSLEERLEAVHGGAVGAVGYLHADLQAKSTKGKEGL
jgi:hypothetical protein